MILFQYRLSLWVSWCKTKFYRRKKCYRQFFFGKITKGINIYGICQSKKCKAFKEEVIISFKGKETFEMADEILNIKCPICEGFIKLSNIGFKFCEYLIKGKIIKDGKIETFQISGESRNSNIIQKSNSKRCGMAMFMELTIKVYIFLILFA